MWSSQSFSWHSWPTISWAFDDESGVPRADLNAAFWQSMMDAGAAGRHRRDYTAENLNKLREAREQKAQQVRRQNDDNTVVAVIMAALFSGALNGC